MNFKEVYFDTCSTISQAARLGNHDVLLHCISEGKPVDVRDNRGWEALHEAAFNGHVECLDTILKQENVNINSKTFEEETALLLACRKGQSACVASLLACGADPNLPTLEEITPLYEGSSENLECVRQLLIAGAEVNHQTYTGDTALHAAVEKGKPDIVNYLLHHGADMLLQNEVGLTPLFVGAQFGNNDCMLELLRKAESLGKDYVKTLVEMPAVDCATPLFIAAQEGNTPCVKSLIQYGADANKQIIAEPDNSFQEDVFLFPLTTALYHKHWQCAEELLEVSDLSVYKYWKNCYYSGDIIDEVYHPVFLAGWFKSPQPMTRMLSFTQLLDQCNKHNDDMPNIFQSRICIRPAIVFAKTCFNSLHRNFQTGVYKLTDCLDKWHPLSKDMWLLFLLTLRLGAQVDINKLPETGENTSCLYWCACLKYSLQYHRGFNDTRNIESESFIRWQHDWEDSFLFKAHDVFRCTRTPDQSGEVKREYSTLQQLCRRSIVLNLIYTSCYTCDGMERLQIPQHLQQYLMFQEECTCLKQTFQKLEDSEKQLNEFLDELDSEKVIPRGPHCLQVDNNCSK